MTANRHRADTHWFCLRSVSGGEWKAKASLLELDAELRRERDTDERQVEVYVPYYTAWISHARKQERKNYPLLRGYLFVLCREGDLWQVQEAHGVCQVFSHTTSNGAFKPARMDEREIGGLMSRQDEGEWDLTQKPSIAIGAKVKVTGGKFQGWVGEVVRCHPGDRQIRIMLQSIIKGGKTAPKDFPIDQVEAA